MSKIKLRTAIVIFFFILAVIGSFAGQFISYNNVGNILAEQAYYHLETTAQSRAEHVKTLLRELKQNIEIAATHQELTNEELKEIMEINEGYYEVFVLDKDGKVMTTTNPEEEIGTDFSEDLFFLEGKKGVYLKDFDYDEEFKRYRISISAPHAEGVLVARIGTEELNEITTDGTGLGETGEVYLVNRKKYLMTPSRFLDNSLLVQEVDTANVKDCIEHYEEFYEHETKEIREHENIMVSSLDYRGENVLGTHSYVPETQWCLLVEIDEAEALDKTRNGLLKFIFIISAIIVFLITAISFFIGRKIEKVY